MTDVKTMSNEELVEDFVQVLIFCGDVIPHAALQHAELLARLERGAEAERAARDEAQVPTEWQCITRLPKCAMMVEYYSTTYPNPVFADEPYRCYARSLGYWDGQNFCELGTGHMIFEWGNDEDGLPTHWRQLPAPPPGGKVMTASDLENAR